MIFLRALIGIFFTPAVLAIPSKGVQYYRETMTTYNRTLLIQMEDMAFSTWSGVEASNKTEYLETTQTFADMYTAFSELLLRTPPSELAATRDEWFSVMANTLMPFSGLKLYSFLFTSADVPKLQSIFLQIANALIDVATAWDGLFCDPGSSLRYFNQVSTSYVSLSSKYGITTDGHVSGYDEICSPSSTTGSSTVSSSVLSTESSSVSSSVFSTESSSVSSSVFSTKSSSVSSSVFSTESSPVSSSESSTVSSTQPPTVSSIEPSSVSISSDMSSTDTSSTLLSSSEISVPSNSNFSSNALSTVRGEPTSSEISASAPLSESTSVPSFSGLANTTSILSTSGPHPRPSMDSGISPSTSGPISYSRPANPDGAFVSSADQVLSLASGDRASVGSVSANPAASNPASPTVVTIVVSAYTTRCPEETTVCMKHACYTAARNTTLTITDCPCTLTSTVGCSYSNPPLCNGADCFQAAVCDGPSCSQKPATTGTSVAISASRGQTGPITSAPASANCAENSDIPRALRAIAAALLA